MKIRKVEIQNFRSYYKVNQFHLCDGLNLIVGSNGDGKTTLFEALEWLFTTHNLVTTDPSFISKKRLYELDPNESDTVSVSVTYEYNNCVKILEKKFIFTKNVTLDVSISNYEFNLIVDNGIERDLKPGHFFEHDLPADLRKYSMFKGESNLDVFQSSNALKSLIDTFSDVKDFDAYFDFMRYATSKSDTARRSALAQDRRNQADITRLTVEIEELTANVSRTERALKTQQTQAETYENLLDNIARSKEAADQLIAQNSRIEELNKRLAHKKSLIKEDYTINLLDDMWVLMGFEEVANEFSRVISEADIERRKLEKEYQQQIGADRLLKRAGRSEEFVPLPAHVPGPKIMEEMLAEEVCKVCGRSAKKDSEAWNFMLAKLNEYKDSLKIEDEDEDDSLYENNYILEMQKRDTILNDNLSDITRLRSRIDERIELNCMLYAEAKTITKNIEDADRIKVDILAQTDALTEEQLTANYENITNWMDGKARAERNVQAYKAELARLQAELQKKQEELNKCAQGTTAQIFSNTWLILNKIAEAFKNAKEENRKRLLMQIEEYANEYLSRLNVGDFTGTIRIFMTDHGNAESALIDADGSRIENPNTALRTTQYMSILFAISRLSASRRERKYPLLFDAPTSSFTASKETSFFNVIGELGNQVIIVTKSFLNEKLTAAGEKTEVVDMAKVGTLNGKVFRIEKRRPFDDNDLATIQTVITSVKE